MDLRCTDEEERFRAEVRSWLKANLPPHWTPIAAEVADDDQRAALRLDWERKLHQGGWSGITWPREYGGRGATLVEQAIFLEESARANAPIGLNIIGRNLTGPVLIAHGTEAQKRRFLPRILCAEDIWCQGFSEPNAGSDLASIRTRAELRGDRFVINGQKIWTSFAEHAQWCILLVRTDPAAPKHKGLSFLLVDLSTPGITRHPIRRINGHGDFSEVFYDDVEVPAENLVGAMNRGWQIAMSTLGFERGPEEALARQVRFRQHMELLLETAERVRRNGRPVIEDSAVRQKLATSLIEVELMRLNCLRAFSAQLAKGDAGPVAAITKLYWSHMNQRMMDTALDVAGAAAPIVAGDESAVAEGLFQAEYLHARAATIYSGTSEIQRNIIAERVLGLPR